MMWLNCLRAGGLVLAVGVLSAGTAERSPNPFTPDRVSDPGFTVQLSRDALGRSGALRTRMVMPGQKFALPLSWKPEPPADAQYQWVSVTDETNHTALTAVPVGSSMLE